jgi:Na+-driven multidrug efflux pump
MLPVGLSQACGVLVGNAVGEGRKDKAFMHYRTSQLLGFIVSIGQIAFLGLGREFCVSIFTNHPEISA